MSFNLRAFIIFFMLLSIFSWFVLEQAKERINIGLRQSAETVLVDTSQFMSALIEKEMEQLQLEQQVKQELAVHQQVVQKQADQNNEKTKKTKNKKQKEQETEKEKQQKSKIATELLAPAVSAEQFDRVFEATLQKKFEHQVYALIKKRIGMHVYITDNEGKLLYYSRDAKRKGESFYNWRDVYLTLHGEYGARSSFLYPDQTAEGDPKVMVVAAPIKWQEQIVGVVSIEKDVSSLDFFLGEETNTLRRYMLTALFLVMALAYLLSHILTLALVRLSNYAKTMAQGKSGNKPKFWDKRLTQLSDDIENLRQQLDGKAYVEGYVHSLTHELKTPITSIHAAAEILKEPLNDDERAQFVQTIDKANQRMASLVDRMLSLAKIESLRKLENTQSFLVLPAVQRLLEERTLQIQEKDIQLQVEIPDNIELQGDPLLLEQAIAGVLDNAIDFSETQAPLKIRWLAGDTSILEIENVGELIPDFAQEKIFERFFSLPRPNTKRRSTGLGLSFVKEIMRLHKGNIEIKNTETGVVAKLQFTE